MYNHKDTFEYMLNSYILIHLLFTRTIQAKDFGIPEAIIGGEVAEVGTQPYLVAIGTSALNSITPSGVVCGGTLIESNVVLSAARE